LFNQENSARLVGLLQKQKPFSDDRPIDKQEIREIFDLLLQYKEEKGSNYEYLLANIQNRAGQPSKSQAERDSCHFIFGLFYEIIHKILC
ncbi:hypothetical protein SB847_21135, partial [Bacillus sp. SIMBA_026]|uniref:hypothetical protein n=1 Tax=Bacillus sp. SIMBA_026 TaxID=3085769 RepID=UPI003978C8BF